jgi:hypothetical protein
MLETNSVALPIEDRLILGFGGTTGGWRVASIVSIFVHNFFSWANFSSFDLFSLEVSARENSHAY